MANAEKAKPPAADVPPAEETAEAPHRAVTAPPPAPRSGTLFVIAVGFLTMILTPLVTFLVIKNTGKADAKNEAVQARQSLEGGGYAYDKLEAVTVNILGTQGTRYLKVKPNLVVSEARLLEELKAYEPLIQDRIIAVCGERTISELEGRRGRDRLKQEIRDSVNEALKGKLRGTVIDVYLTEYLIQ